MGVLENDIIKLRAIEPEDIDLLYKWENDTEIWHVGTTLIPFSKFILEEFINQATLDIFEAKQIRLMIDSKTSKKTVGCVDLFDFNPQHQRAGVGILIHNKDDRKKYYATEALNVTENYAFRTLLIKQLYCNISATNKVSLALFRKLGYSICGTKKDWLRTSKGWEDELMLQRINHK